MKTKANVLITELFASAIFEERVVETINDAKRRLLTEDCIIIPHNVVIFAQVVDYPDVAKENWVRPMTLPDGRVINFPEEMRTCSSKSNMATPTQISSLGKDEFTIYSDPVEIFNLEFGGDDLVNEKEKMRFPFKSKGTGVATAIFSWWTLELDQERQIQITLKPYWAGGSTQDVRYHWSPVVYYGQEDFQLQQNTKYYLEGFRGKFCAEQRIEMCFRISASSSIALPTPDPWDISCRCGFHEVYTYQIRKWNDRKFISQHVLAGTKVTGVIGEPFFMKDKGESIFDPFPTFSRAEGHTIWWYHLRYFRFLLEMGLAPTQTRISPCKAVIRGVLMRFENLSRINSPLSSVLDEAFFIEGFADSYKEKAVEDPSGVEYEFLWQFPGIACGESFDILKIHNDGIPVQTSLTECKSEREDLEPNGVAIWIDWYLTEDIITSNGPSNDIVVGQPVKWTNIIKQAVKLHRGGWKDAVKFRTEYFLHSATVRFQFERDFEQHT